MGGCYDVVHSFFFVTRRRQALLRESSHVRAIASGRRPQRPRQVETAAPRVGFTTYQQAKSSRRQPFRFRARPRRDDAADSAAVELVTATFVKMCDASRGVHTRSSAPDFAFIAIGRPSHAVNRTAALSAAPASSPTPRAATPPAPPCFTDYGHDAESLQTTARRSASTSLGRRRAATSASCVHPFFVFRSGTASRVPLASDRNKKHFSILLKYSLLTIIKCIYKGFDPHDVGADKHR